MLNDQIWGCGLNNNAYNFSELRVLLVDDHEPMREVLRDILRELGFRDIQQAQNGEKALRVLPFFQPDILITDYMMQPVNGLELIRKVRAGEAEVDRFLPIIMISSHTEAHEVLRARDAGTTEFLAKPLSARLLFNRLKSLIENPRPFVEADEYFGPDRRRRVEPMGHANRRTNDYDYEEARTMAA